MFAPTADEDDINTKMNMLLLMFPQGEFNFFSQRVAGLRNQRDFENFVTNLIETGNYPKRQRTVVNNHTVDRQGPALVPFLIEPFDAEDFLLEYQFQPDRFFERMPRDLGHKNMSLNYIMRRYPHLTEQYIGNVLRNTAFDLIKAKDALENPSGENATQAPPRFVVPLPDNLDNIPEWSENFKREVQYFVHKEEVIRYMEIKAEMRVCAVKESEQLECECCYSNEMMADEVTSCTQGHVLCIPCILQFLECVKQRRFDVSCVLVDYCSGLIPWAAIRNMMSPHKFVELRRRRQMLEVQGSGLSDVEFCASCSYGVIPGKTDVVIQCPSCGFDTCRQCRAESHVPRKCYEPEVAKPPPQATKDRYKEEVLTASVLRKCPRCKVSILKDGGCDNVLCRCGSSMNYGRVIPGKDPADIPTCSSSAPE